MPTHLFCRLTREKKKKLEEKKIGGKKKFRKKKKVFHKENLLFSEGRYKIL